MQVSTKRYWNLNCSKKESKRNHHYKLNNFQLFKKGDSNMTTALKRDLVIYSDLSMCLQDCSDICGISEKKTSEDEIRIYANGKCWNKKFKNKKKKAISGKHYSYDRYLAKKKGMVMHKMISDNMNYLNDRNLTNKLHNPCTWQDPYKNYMNYGNQPKNKKYPSQHPSFKPPLPTGHAGAKTCSIYNCYKLGKSQS